MNSRSLLHVVVLGCSLSLGCLPQVAFAEIISSFDVTASISPDRTVLVQEAIKYDFLQAERHGIERVIPIRSERNGGTYGLRLTVQDVARDARAEPYTQSTANGSLTLRIGNPKQTISGSHVYSIRYATDRAINFFPDHDELYWNVTGNEWYMPIEQASFSIQLPDGVDMSAVSSACYMGAFGSTESDCVIVQLPGNVIKFSTRRVLESGEGLTIVLGVPKGVIRAPTTTELFLQIVSDNKVLVLPLLAFIVMFSLWWRRGRDPKRATVIPEYGPPEKLSPALCGAMLTEGAVPARTITATIVDLARRGYLTIDIEQTKGFFGLGHGLKYTFIKHKKDMEADAELTDYEKNLFSGLFTAGETVKLDDLQKNAFYSSVSSFRKHVQQVVDARKMFVANPTAIRGAYLVAAFVCAWIIFAFSRATGVGIISAVVTATVIGGFGLVMPSRTVSGTKLLAQIKGFKWFLSVTEKDRLDFHNAPERTPTQFMEFLPYAIAFEVEKKWAEQFASLDIPPPSWATGSGMHNLNMLAFVSTMDSLHTAASASSYTAPSSAGSGGSGFSGGGSGGGFGGGGGGSW